MHMAQLIPLLLTVSCSRKSRLVFILPFGYRLTQVVPNKIHRALKVVVVVVVVAAVAVAVAVVELNDLH